MTLYYLINQKNGVYNLNSSSTPTHSFVIGFLKTYNNNVLPPSKNISLDNFK